MSAVTTAVLTALGSEEGTFHAPGPGSFELPPVFSIGDFDVTKPMLLLVLSVPLIVGFFWAASKKHAVVPGKLQFVGEYVYGFVRNGVARDSIGSHDFLKFVPLLFALFTFVLVNNYFSLIPFLQFPSFSRFGFVVPIALLVWVVYNGVGVAKHGFLGYLKTVCVPGGITGPILVLIIPLEFLSTILVRPATLALRLFANMFAGHLLLTVFTVAAFYLASPSVIGILGSATSFLMTVIFTAFEALIQALQAYIFTLLTAVYIAGSLHAEH